MATNEEQLDKAIEVVAYYTLAASVMGAVPVPAVSAAIAAENGFMITHVASALGAEIDISNVLKSLSLTASLNIVGRTVFVEGAKLLAWGTASLWAAAALSALGATTAGLQTYMLGRITIEIGKNDGKKLDITKASEVIEEAKSSYDKFIDEWKTKDIDKPDDPESPAVV